MSHYSRRTVLAGAAAALGTAALPRGARAQQDYPTKPIRLIVPFTPGAGNDVMARFTANEIQPRLGQPVVVENRPGAGSQTGIHYVSKEPPDGYTLVWAASDGISLLPAVKPSVPYRVPDDFEWVASVTKFPLIAMTNPNQNIKTLGELVAYGKANPGKLRYGSSGVGTGPHLVSSLIANATGLQMVHIPYQGAAPAVTALLGGHIDLMVTTPSTAIPHHETGKLVMIATTGPKRHPLLPNTQTVAEAGWPSVESELVFGVLAPLKTPAPVVARLSKEIETMCNDPKAQEGLRKIGYDALYMNGNEFKNFAVKDLERWKTVAKQSNISVPE